MSDGSSKEKIFVLDTNVLVHDPDSVHAFDEHKVVIPILVIEELDKLKRNKNNREVAFQARAATRRLAELRKGGSLLKGIPTPGGGLVMTDPNHVSFDNLPVGFEKCPDNAILLFVQRMVKDHPEAKVILITKDFNMQIKAEAMGLYVEDYRSDKTDGSEVLYRRMSLVEVPVEKSILTRLYRDGSISTEDNGLIAGVIRTLSPNACCKLVTGDPDQYALAIYKPAHQKFVLVLRPSKRTRKRSMIMPRNDEQCVAYDLLSDDSIPCCLLAGPAGTGKSLMAYAAGLQAVFEKRFRKLSIYRSNIEIGEKNGFLPGDLSEKFGPWAQPAIDCINLILADQKKHTVGSLIEAGLITIQPLSFIRGATFPGSFNVFDEAQNWTPKIGKTIVTRAGKGAKIVFTGDLVQIDADYLDPESNCLAHIAEKFKGQRLFANIYLKKGERSELAELAAQLL
jgi:PhoH-like ATPase